MALPIKNTTKNYGVVSIILHWLVALSVFSLFGLGFYMVDLDYYSTWYQTAPDLHKSIGICLFAVMVLRALWRNIQPTPEHLPSHSKLERRIGHITHISLYIIFFLICISGYLITTADGRGIEVFGLFTVPSLGEFIQNQEDIAGSIHEWLAYSIIALSGLHALGALKHHFIDKDATLKRMLGKTS